MKFICYEDYKREIKNLENNILENFVKDNKKKVREYFEMIDIINQENFEFSLKYDDENRQSDFLKRKKQFTF